MLTAGSADALPDVQKSPVIQNLVQKPRARRAADLGALGHASARPSAHAPAQRRSRRPEAADRAPRWPRSSTASPRRRRSRRCARSRSTKSVNEIKTRIVNTGPDEAKLRSLEANAKSKRAELDRLRAQFEANRVTATTAAPFRSRRRSSPWRARRACRCFPKKCRNTLLVAVATLMFGMAIVVTRGLLAGRVGSGDKSAALPVGRCRAREPGRGPVAGRISRCRSRVRHRA